MTKRPTDRRPFALSRNTTCCLALPRGSVVFMIRGYGQTIRPRPTHCISTPSLQATLRRGLATASTLVCSSLSQNLTIFGF
jgi:hypothetical protein